MQKSFLLLQSRPENEASDDEYQAFLKFANLKPEELVRVRVEAGEYPEVNFDDFSGIIMGGGPFNFATPEDKKSADQRAFEGYMMPLLRRIIDADFPFLGACLGVGALVTAEGGQMSYDKGEDVGAVDIVLSKAGRSDDLLSGVADTFRGFVGHKEGVGELPTSCTVLAESKTCVQMIRIKQNVYATQFHPELDGDGLALRIRIYKHAGYFAPEEADALIQASTNELITEPEKILQNFINKYKR